MTTCDLCGKKISHRQTSIGIGSLLDGFSYSAIRDEFAVCSPGVHLDCDRECAELYNLTAISADDCVSYCSREYRKDTYSADS